MLIGNGPRRPNLERVRMIKAALREALKLPEDATITVTELACLEEGCAPVETVVGLLRPGEPQLQHKLHKPTNRVDAEDLAQASMAWGFEVPVDVFVPLLPPQEN